MSVTLDQASEILALRDRSFVACDIDAYLSIWAPSCTVEGPAHFIVGRDGLRRVIEAAWSIQQPLHMSTFSVGVGGDRMFHEFAIVWENRASKQRMLQTGSSISAVDASGRWSWLREYFDPATARRASAAHHPAIEALLSPA